MTMLNRRRFLVSMGATAVIVGSRRATALDLKKMLQGTQPYMQDAQSLIQTFRLSEQDESQIGETYYEDYIQQSGGRYPDRQTQDALQQFAQPFLAASTRQELKWDIVLVKNDTVNAWAIPGGKLAIHSGLVGYTNDPSELGSVISHEIGHAELSHGIKQMRTEAFMSSVSAAGKRALAQYAGGGMLGLTGDMLGALEGPVFQMINAGYSRKREFEADAHIMTVFDQTGMDASKADDFFRTLKSLYPQNTDITTSLFSTHPGTQARIDRLEQMASSRTRPRASSDLPSGWKTLKERFPTRPV